MDSIVFESSDDDDSPEETTVDDVEETSDRVSEDEHDSEIVLTVRSSIEDMVTIAMAFSSVK